MILLLALLISVLTVVVVVVVRVKEKFFFDTVTPSSVIPYKCDSDSALFGIFGDRTYSCYPGSQLVDACNAQLKSKFPNSSHKYLKAKCMDDTHTQYDDPQGCKYQLQCTPDIKTTCTNGCELKSAQALQDCNSSGGDLNMCSFQKLCSNKCEVKDLAGECAAAMGDLSKCTQASVHEKTCKTKCAMTDTQSINACIANKATDFSVCTPTMDKSYVLTGIPPNTKCVFFGTGRGKYTRAECISMGYVV